MLKRLFDSAWFYFFLAGLLLVLAVLSQIQFSSPSVPSGSALDLLELENDDDLNVVFIVVDTLRADRLEPYGYHRGTSPVLSELADRGIVFDQVESQSSWTKASMASMWLGMYPEHSGVQRFMHGIPAEALMPAEVFRANGFRTAGVWRNGWVANNFGFGQGFDLYYRPGRNRPTDNVRRFNPSAYKIPGTDLDASESAMEFIFNNSRERFFLYVHYMDVHQYLYADSSPDFGTSFPDIYDSAIHWTDRNIGMLINMLREQRLLDRTLVVIASDHGEAFWEHGVEGHARNVYKEVQRVPWIIVPPFEMERIDVEDRVANVDIWPTIFDLIGFDPLPDADGQSLVPLILAGAGIESPEAEALRGRALFAQLDRTWGFQEKEPNPIISVVRDDYRYVEFTKKRENGELFDRRDDELERKNVVEEKPEVKGELTVVIDEFLASPAPGWNAIEVELDEMKKNQLRALGYVIPAQDRRQQEREDQARTGADGDSDDGDGAAD